jgi:hypothetical protein
MSLTEVSSKNVFQRFFGSLGGIVVGILLIVVAIGLLYYNDGRENPALVAQKSVELQSSDNPSDYQGSFVSVTGDVTVNGTISDDLFLVPQDYLAIKRTVEVYAWVEKTDSTTETRVGGGEETTTNYSYVKEWVSKSSDSSKFKQPQQPANTPKPYEDETFYQAQAQLGNFSFDPSSAGVGGFTELSLNSSNTIIESLVSAQPGSNTLPNYTISGNFIYSSESADSSPQIGDYRVSYQTASADIFATVFGKVQSDGQISRHKDSKTNISIGSLYLGDRDTALESMDTAFKAGRWALRIVGFLMIWFGLMSILRPLTIFLDVVPFFGKLSRSVIAFITFPIALIIAALVIIISLIINNLWSLILALVIIGGSVAGGVWFYQQKKQQGEPKKETKSAKSKK